MVYKPTDFSVSKKSPVIYVFDPHGNGLLAVNQFVEAAERFEFIIVGSNNSHNGAPNIEHIVEALVADVQSQFPIETSRQYAAGFSGGGRVAAYMAEKSGILKGIITCGAGIPELNPNSSYVKFDIYAMAGRNDFNYQEVMNLTQQMQGSDWRYMVVSFSGNHNWPPHQQINEAVAWLYCNAMRDHQINKDKLYLNALADSFASGATNLVDRKCSLFALEKCNQGIQFLKDLTNIDKLDKLKGVIEISESFNADRQKNAHMANIEGQVRNGYLRAFTEKDGTWWNNEIDALLQKKVASTDSFERQMLCRLKSFLGMACYSYTQQFLNDNNQAETQKILDVYTKLEPQNPDCFFFKAVLADRQLQTKQAVKCFKTALDLGFTDRGKAQKMLSDQVIKLSCLK
jgi:predicted esterase